MSGSSRQLTLKKGAPKIRCEICYVSCYCPLMWMMHLHVNKKSDYDDDMRLSHAYLTEFKVSLYD